MEHRPEGKNSYKYQQHPQGEYNSMVIIIKVHSQNQFTIVFSRRSFKLTLNTFKFIPFL